MVTKRNCSTAIHASEKKKQQLTPEALGAEAWAQGFFASEVHSSTSTFA
jgi:hypothetical protein